MNETLEKIATGLIETLEENKDAMAANSMKDSIFVNLTNMGYSDDIAIAVGNAAAEKLLELAK